MKNLRMEATTPDIPLPADLAPLAEIATNLWWCWHPDAVALFQHAGGDLWHATEHNPVAILQKLSTKRKKELAGDRKFMAHMRRVHRAQTSYLRAKPWYTQKHPKIRKGLVAYFSMEFGLHESLPIYAGGLGILAGDHFKSASDLGLPLVGVGMFWHRGYVRQVVDAKNVQQAEYDRLKPEALPFQEVKKPSGQKLRIRIPVGKGTVRARAWRLDVGRTPILLLDTNIKENKPKDRKLTERLYAGDRDTRIRQEIVLGIGGWKLLRALELDVKACHLNEGHAVFCALEQLAEWIDEAGLTLKQAAREVARTTVFTTHTPVPAGNETFEPTLVHRYLDGYCQKHGIDIDTLHGWSRIDPANEKEPFGMTPLALRLSNKRNGVAALHGAVSRDMWRGIWPNKKANQVPIGHVTNGIHIPTWMNPKMFDLLNEYLPKNWLDRQDAPAVWKAVDKIPNQELWALHLELKQELIDFSRCFLASRLEKQGRPKREISAARGVLDPDALTIGFARRFAPYKRATLLFSDKRRADKIFSNARRPVQIVFSGKAHPADEDGKALVSAISKLARSRKFAGKVVFLEDYTIDIARHMIAGVDVWLNNPRRPQEASGTSGMKPPLHGGLNLSILDGWWPEGCKDGVNGWAIGKGKDHNGKKSDDIKDAKALYARLEKDVIPAFFDQNKSGVPTKWVRRMKSALKTIPAEFSSHRMVKDYLKGYYLPILRK